MKVKRVCHPSPIKGVDVPPIDNIRQVESMFVLASYWKGMDNYGYRPYLLEYEEKDNGNADKA